MKKFLVGFLKWFGVVLLALATALVLFIFIQRVAGDPGNPPSLFGYRFFQVLTGSMEPELHVDDVILVKKTEISEIKKGDIISYYCTEDLDNGLKAGDIVTHKVIEDPVYANGVYRLQTSGIEEGSVPDAPIVGEQVLGKFAAKLPLMKYVYKIFTRWYGLLIFLLVLFALFMKELFNLRRIIKSRPEDYMEDGSAAADSDKENIKFEDIPAEEVANILKSHKEDK